jgi:hypothetical protein
MERNMSNILYQRAPDEIIELAEEIIKKHHPLLEDARIGFILRSEAAMKDGKPVMGQAKKVTDEQRVYVPFDFIIVLAADEWRRLSTFQQRALVDHELCHCTGHPGDWHMRAHDYEEFWQVIDRYGMWQDADGRHTEVVQEALIKHKGIGGVGKVEVENFKRTLSSMGATNVRVTFGGARHDN